MKKILLVVLIVLVGCATVPEASSPNLEAIRRVAGQIDYYDHLEPELKDYYNDGNEFQGQCNDYSLLYSLETGAYIVAVNNFVKNGIYKVSSRDPGSSSIIQWLSRNSNQPRTPSGEIQSIFYRFSDNYGERYGLYHPKIGAYMIRFVTTNPDVEYLAIRMGVQHVFNAHPDGSGGWTYVDVSKFDCWDDWRVNY